MEEQQKTEQQKGLEIINILTQKKAKDVAVEIGTKIAEGTTDPRFVSVIMKKFAKVQEELFKQANTKESIIEAFKPYLEKNKKTIEMFGAKITITNTGYWDFSSTDDPYLESLKEIQAQVKELVTAREDQLKAKAKEWHSINNPSNVVSFGLKPFVVSYDTIPKLIFEEAADEIETNPPIQRGQEGLRFSV